MGIPQQTNLNISAGVRVYTKPNRKVDGLCMHQLEGIRLHAARHHPQVRLPVEVGRNWYHAAKSGGD
jgi:hypothetical protein